MKQVIRDGGNTFTSSLNINPERVGGGWSVAFPLVISFEDDVTVILLLGVSFKFPSPPSRALVPVSQL
jgi:hypothetical protein